VRERESIDAKGVNLDEIQEEDPNGRPTKLGALVLASLGGACIVFAAVALLRSPAKTKPVASDPLGDLVAKSHPAGANEESPRDVTFPGVLSDAKQPTTALEAQRDPRPSGSSSPFPFQLPPGAPTVPPEAADRLPVVPLPAQDVVEQPGAPPPASDTLSTIAKRVARDDGAESALPGTAGGYQLQVSSFKTTQEADAFAAALRRRGHKAYVEPANVKGRGMWYRVKIGPFKYRHAAVIYRQEFEAKERMVTFIVDPPKTTVKVEATLSNDDDN
jgi:cell division septation protein DedD